MNDTAKTIFQCGVVPVIKLDDAKDAAPLCGALLDGGIHVAEITFRTSAAADSIKSVADTMPDVFVGAGTVTSVELAKKAIASGARFIVTPGMNVRVVEYCLENDIPVFPGTSCPTDIETGLHYGLEVLKFFPAEASGGLKALKAMAAPYGAVRFMPTGGIDASNITDYLKFDKVIACGGSWMVKEDLVKAGNFAEITRLTREAVSKLHSFTFAHMGINTADKAQAAVTADTFAKIFGLPTRETSAGGFFASDFIEVMNGAGPGANGHIGIRTTNVARAIAYFERQGIELDYETLRGTADKPTFIYLKHPVGGFAVHIVQ